MTAKTYVLIDVNNGKSEQVVKTLRNKAGVVIIELVEGPPDAVMVVKATERQELAKLTIAALLSVEGLTDGVKCLPVIEEGSA